ncbi:hypothetical protein [Enterovirga sp.]|uniref:hypothetical protein n=1 Tax=Enterovirga sp. TaxID=2026350 RepID=UPI002CCCD33C|nr:hypothetical protein [Enterovirga sp.]HMO28188.1 hypothetical protein [Enterovirga sp.]
MRRFRLPLILVAATLGTAQAAQAQNFFERLFGIGPRAPEPVAPAPAAPEAPPPGEAPKPRAPAAPVQARVVSLRVPTEDGVIGRELKQNGSSGSLKIERVGGGSDLRARMTLIGRRGQSVESCSVQLEGKLASEGRTEGLNRYKMDESGCAFSIDVFDDAVLVRGTGEACQFSAANCQADPAGLWGPDPGTLIPKARDYESARASADKAVRDNYKALVQRARPEAVRPIVAEQAAFSSDREITCRTYAREPQHSFCDARYSEGRAIMLAQRLGVTVASAQPNPGGSTRVRIREQASSEPRDPYALPATNEIVERNPFDD